MTQINPSAFFSNSFAFWSHGVKNVWVTPDLLQQKSISPGCNTWMHLPDNIPVNFVCTHPTVFNSSCLINLQLLWRICFKVPEKLGIHDTTNDWAGVCMLVMCLYWKELFPQVIIFKKIIYLFWTLHIGLLQHRTCTTRWGAQWNCMWWPRIASWRKGWRVDFLQRLWEKPIW